MKLIPPGIPGNLYKYGLVLFLITLVLRIILVGYYNNNLGGIETNVIYGIQRILLGQPLYQDPVAGSYAIIQYTPVYYYFTAFVARLTGIKGTDVQGIYMLCRVLALAFNLISICIMALMIRMWGFSLSKSLVFALPLLIVLTTHYYTRGDSMHLLFFIAAMYAYIRYSKEEKTGYILIAALLSALCIMTKQSGVLVMGIICFHLFFAQRKYVMTALFIAATFLCAFTVGWYCTNGNWLAFYQNVYLGLKNGIDLSFLYNIFIGQFYLEIVPCYLLAGILVSVAIKEITDTTFRIFVTGAALSWLFAVITGLKIGSSNNYFMEFLVFIILCLPYLFENENSKKVLFRLSGYRVTIYHFACITFFILITSKTLGFFTAVVIDKRLNNDRTEYTNEIKLYAYFKNDLKIKTGDHILFTERNFLDNIFIEYAIMPTKDVVSETYLCDPTTFNYSHFIAGMNNGLINYIVTDEKKKDLNRWNSQIPFMHFDENRFKLLANKYGYSIFAYTE